LNMEGGCLTVSIYRWETLSRVSCSNLHTPRPITMMEQPLGVVHLKAVRADFRFQRSRQAPLRHYG
jgi:hypothetical protein